MKKNKVIFSCLTVMLPSLFGLLLWDKLPSQMITHFNFAGEPDGYSSKAFAIILLPFILLLAHLVTVFAVSHDPKKDNINSKLNSLTLWICPVVSIITMGVIISASLGVKVPVSHLVFCLLGVVFVIIGNLMPKCQPNYTVGIKLPWTLNDSENWRKTHRMAGPLWILGGFIIIVSPFLGNIGSIIFLVTVILMVVIPVIYSYNIYKKI